MPTSNETPSNPLAALIVYSRTISGIPQAAWFKAEDRAAVKAAAEPMKLSVLDLRTDEEKALAAGVGEGALKGGGRMIIGSVSPEVFRRIEGCAQKAAAATSTVRAEQNAASGPAVAKATESAGASPTAKPVTAPTSRSAGPAPSQAPVLANPWDSLRVGSTVLAAYFDQHSEIEGWWPAVVTRADKDEFVLKWRDTSEYALGKVEKKHIAILHPEFLASGK
jgi:hypothetical protein